MWNYNVCAIFLLDATFITDPAKFVSGALLSLSAMVQLELPHLNVLTKCDLADRSEVSVTPYHRSCSSKSSSARMLEMSQLGVGAVLHLIRDVWRMVKRR